jgi:hypothetical protein
VGAGCCGSGIVCVSHNMRIWKVGHRAAVGVTVNRAPVLNCYNGYGKSAPTLRRFKLAFDSRYAKTFGGGFRFPRGAGPARRCRRSRYRRCLISVTRDLI